MRVRLAIARVSYTLFGQPRGTLGLGREAVCPDIIYSHPSMFVFGQLLHGQRRFPDSAGKIF